MSAPQPPRGIPTWTPEQSAAVSCARARIARRVASFGYDEIRLPVLENGDLFERAVGAATDIVEKEMYAFTDRNDARVCLRPEGTAGCAASAMRLGLIAGGRRARLWYSGPFFRRERPQKGRYRQFHQVGVEAFGFDGAGMDVELLTLTALMWEDLGLRDAFELQINTLGDADARRAHRKALLDYLQAHADALDDNARKRMHDNPLRVLDSKDPGTRRVVASAPPLADYLDETSRAHYAFVKGQLERAGVAYVENPRLVRGLDYYTGLVFEWVTPGAAGQNTVCAGGRYDGLVELLGGGATPAAGFAVGLERIAAALDYATDDKPPTAYAVAAGEAAVQAQAEWLMHLRRAMPEWVVIGDGDGGLKAQLKRADKHAAAAALIVGDDELARGEVTVRCMADGAQQSVAQDAVAAALKRLRPAPDE